jgi:hypothetical protein
MRRALLLAAAFLLALAGCGGAEPPPLAPARAAEPQQAKLGWKESYPTSGPRLVFAVDTLTVRDGGWSVDVAVTNLTPVPFAAAGSLTDLAYGLMLFATDDLGELEDAARRGGLPAVRRATAIEPEPPTVIGPNETWRATLSGPGSLADGSYVRVSLGPLRAKGEPPAGIEPIVVWITDRAHRL